MCVLEFSFLDKKCYTTQKMPIEDCGGNNSSKVTHKFQIDEHD